MVFNFGGLFLFDIGIIVCFDVVLDNIYLILSIDEDVVSKVVYQKVVLMGVCDFKFDFNDWKVLFKDVVVFILFGGQIILVVLFLKWGMFQDKNSNGKFDVGEWLNCMIYDCVVYVDKVFQVEFDEFVVMYQVWNIVFGWSCVEYYVYVLLEGKDDFWCFLCSIMFWDFMLYVEMLLSSM